MKKRLTSVFLTLCLLLAIVSPAMAAPAYTPPHLPTAQTATKVVAAADTPAYLKARADYVCDGVADDVQIRQAIKDVLNLSNGLTHYGSTTTVVVPGMNFALMYYDGSTYYAYGGDATYANIVCSTSTDKYTWTDPVVVLAKGSESQVAVANVWKEGSTWYMLYRASGTKINLATSTTSATSGWANYASNPVINDGVGYDPAGLIKVSSTYYLFTNTTGGDREINVYTSTTRTSWTKIAGNPIFTGGRYCAAPFLVGSTYYLIVSKYYDGGVGSMLELWSCPDPRFLDGMRTYLGVLVFDATHESVDTPSIITLDITRSTFPDDKFIMYYSKKISGGSASIAYPALLCEEATVPAAIAKAVMPGKGTVALLPGTYNINPPSPNYNIEIPYGVTVEGNNATLKLVTGFSSNTTVPAAVSVDNTGMLRNVTLDGNTANTTGTHYGLTVAKGGIADNVTVQNWKNYGMYKTRGLFNGGKVRRNAVYGAHVAQYGILRGTEVLGNGSANNHMGVMLDSYGRLEDCQIHNNYVGLYLVDTAVKAIVKGGAITENLYWGAKVAGTNSSVLFDGVYMCDNAGYNLRGQLDIEGGKVMVLNCTLEDIKLANSYHSYVTGGTALFKNCLIAGGSAKVYDASAYVTHENTTATTW